MKFTFAGKSYLIISLFWCFVVLYIAFASIPFNPLSLSFTKSYLYSLVPEGWGFFTRNPKEEVHLVFKKTRDNRWKLFTKSNADPEFSFGISRKNRRILAETQYLIEKLDDTMFLSRDGNAFNFSTKKIILTKSAFKNPILTGDLILVKQKRLPWAWSENYKEINMPYQIARVHVQ